MSGNGTDQACGAHADGAGDDQQRRGKFQFLDDEELENLKPPAWLIEGILPEQATATLVGKSGDYKSFVALDLASCVATGTPWLGHYPVKRGLVVYIVAEGAGGFSKRIRAWKLYHRFDGRAGVRFLPHPVQLTRREGKDVNELLRVLGELPEPPVLIIIDTQARCTVGADEDKAKDMGLFVDAVARIREEFGACTLTVHHTGWRSNGRERGSSAVRAAADTVILVEKQKDGIVRLTCEKQKDADEFDSITLCPCTIDLGDGNSSLVLQRVSEVGDSGKPRSPDDVSGSERRLLSMLVAHGEQGVPRKALVGDGFTEDQLKKLIPPLRTKGLLGALGRKNQQVFITEKGLAALGHTSESPAS